ncbi:DNRLRE domain-containing protein [Vibrio sp. 1-Bac 57]
MLTSKRLLIAVTTSFCLMSALISTTAQASLITSTPDTIVSVSLDGDLNSAGSVNSGSLSNTEIIARERGNQSQGGLRIATFIDFDLSNLTSDVVNASTFSALFEIDFVSRLNTINDLSVLLGQVESAWSDASGSLPLFEYANSSTSQSVALGNVKTDSFGTYSVDVTSIIQGWVNGDSENNGFVLFGEEPVFQGAGFNNASLVVDVPAPSTIAILGLALVGFSLSRKAKK